MKHCDCIVLNDTSAISSLENQVEILSPDAETMAEFQGLKTEIAEQLLAFIETQIVGRSGF
jgi:phosphopantothenoylcysteine synthetase/decarboxylase